MNETVTNLRVDDEIDESRHRAQSTGLQGRPNQFCDPSVETFTPRHPSFGRDELYFTASEKRG